MLTIMSRVRSFLVNEDGPTAVEYAVLLALIVVAIASIIGALGTAMSSTFSTVSSTLGSGS